jgi:hypothetical protein
VDALDRRLLEAQGEAARLEARWAGVTREPIDVVAARYSARTLELERAGSRLRTVARWDVRLTAGMIPQRGAADWYALAELSFKPGGLVQDRQEREYLAARVEELRGARYEAEASLTRLREEARAALETARRDLDRVENQLARLARMKGLLDASETPGSLHARDALRLEELLVQAEQVHLKALVEGLAQLAEPARPRS